MDMVYNNNVLCLLESVVVMWGVTSTSYLSTRLHWVPIITVVLTFIGAKWNLNHGKSRTTEQGKMETKGILFPVRAMVSRSCKTFPSWLVIWSATVDRIKIMNGLQAPWLKSCSPVWCSWEMIEFLRDRVQTEKSLDHWAWSDKMTQWCQVAGTKPDNLNPILGTQMTEREDWLLKVVSGLCTCALPHVHLHSPNTKIH